MKKYLGIFLAAVLFVMMAVAVSAADVYVNDGGTGDGSSAESPLGNMTEAIYKVADEGGKVIIVDTYTCAEEYTEPEHAGDIVISGGKYIFTNGSYNRWFLSGTGSTTFENVTFEYGAGTTSLFIARFNELIFGEGITFPADGKCYVIGGYQKTAEFETLNDFDGIVTDRDSNITVNSGNFHCVAGFNRGAGTMEFTGTSHITVNGGTIGTVYGGNINGDNKAGAAEIVINGGDITTVRTSCEDTKPYVVTGDATVTVNGGFIGTVMLNNVFGNAVINYNGGKIMAADKFFATELDPTLYAESSIRLNIGADVDELDYMMLPLTLGYENTYDANGELITFEIPEETTAAPVETTEAPEETEAPETTEEAPATEEAPNETEVPETTAAPVAEEDGGNATPIIIAVVAVVIVVAVVAVIVAKKKK